MCITLPVVTSASQMVNYDKWDNLDTGSDDEDKGPVAPAADVARELLGEWMRESTDITTGERHTMIDFISVQLPRIGHDDNLPRAAEIIEFLERHSPRSEVLLDVLWHCRRKDETADRAELVRITRVRAALFGSLNTLEAVAAHGGARPLFDALGADAELRRGYAANKFANERYKRHCSEVIKATVPPPPAWVVRWNRLKRYVAAFWCVLVAVAAIIAAASREERVT